MSISQRGRLYIIALAGMLLLACTVIPRRATPTPALPQLTAQAGPALTVTLSPIATRKTEPSPSPTPTPKEPAATATPKEPGPTATPRAAGPALPAFPNEGPLPAPWTAIEFAPPGLNPRYPAGLALDAEAGVAYAIARCEEDAAGTPQACIAVFDLAGGTVRRVVPAPGDGYGRLFLAGDTLYLHQTWAGVLHVLDRPSLTVRRTISDVYGLALDEENTLYLATEAGLQKGIEEPTAAPLTRSYPDSPAAMAAGGGRVYLLGYDALYVLDMDLEPVVTLPFAEGQGRAMVLSPDGRLYLGLAEEISVLEPGAVALTSAPLQIQGPREMALNADGSRLFVLGWGQADWFGSSAVTAVDTGSWQTQTLYTTLNASLAGLAADEQRGRLWLASQNDHALLPIDWSAGGALPRLPLGLEVIEVLVDEAGGRLYVSDSAGYVHVLDRKTYAPLGKVYGGQHISLDPQRGLLYAGDSRQNGVVVIDTATLETVRLLPQPGKPRANPAAGEVVIVNRRFYVFGAGGDPRPDLIPGVGLSAPECPGCYYQIGVEVTIDAARGLTATEVYMPRPGKPGPSESVAVDPASGRTYYSLLTGGYVYYSSIALYPDLGQLQARGQPLRLLTGLSGRIRLDPPARRLYVTRGRYLFVLDSETLDQVARLDVVDWTPAVAAVDAGLGRLYIPHAGRLAVWTRTGGAAPALLPHERAVIGGSVIAIRPSPAFADDGMVLAMVDGALYRSTDRGQSWVRLRGGLPEIGSYIYTLDAVFSPAFAEDQTIFFSATLGDSHGEGVYRSTDGGQTWRLASQGLLDRRVYRLVPAPGDEEWRTLLAYARTEQGEALYRSDDRGASWELVLRQVSYNQPPMPRPAEMFPGTPVAPQFRCDYNGLCERSADGGATWTQIDTGTYQPPPGVAYALSTDYDRDGLVYFLTEKTLLRYNDWTGRGEVCTSPPLNRERDYRNALSALAVADAGREGSLLLIGSRAGEFLALQPEALDWAPAWPEEPGQSPVVPATATPAPTPTPCASVVDPRLAPAATPSPLARLGCAAGPAVEIPLAYQPFELGMMFWRGDVRQVDVLRQDGTWESWADTWVEGQPVLDPALTPPPGRFQPMRGFGKVWREALGGPEAWIGWATAQEQGGAGLVQTFEQGFVVRGLEGVIYVLYADGTWVSY